MVEVFAKEYMDFMTECKTERECVDYVLHVASAEGFRDLREVAAQGLTLSVGDGVYYEFMNKAAVLFRVGENPLTQGLNILGAHIDTCRIDLKQNPLYEKDGLAFFDTHYYGGIKKYQWVTIPLELRGVVVKKDGSVVKVAIGAELNDPVFCVTDLLIHLAQDQMKKEASKVVTGENLDVLVGSLRLESEDLSDKESVKKNILRILDEKFGIGERDFLSAELAFVPAGGARESGLDRSMILAYGQDDRVCAFASLKAFLEVGSPRRTACCLLVDKEEIGSFGATGMRSKFFENALAELLQVCGQYSEFGLRKALQNSFMLSSDVSSAFDPLYADVFDKNNVAYLGRGMVFNKFTGSRGKSGASEANAEFVAKLRNLLDGENISYQFSELGKVDIGGGGTIAHMTASYGMNVIDAGVPVLSMHAPFELTSKFDIFQAKLGYAAFLRNLLP